MIEWIRAARRGYGYEDIIVKFRIKNVHARQQIKRYVLNQYKEYRP
jgi:hypothetical protein